MKPDEKTLSETEIQSVVEFTPTVAKVVLDSQIMNSLMGCYRLTDLRFNHNFQAISGKSNSLECGSIMHKFLEFYYGSLAKGTNKKDAFQIGMAKAELYIQSDPNDLKEYPGVRNTPMESNGNVIGWQYVLDTCQQYFDFWIKDHWVPLWTEQVRSKVLFRDDEMEILWKAKIDLNADTNQGIFPVDHKTGKQNRETIVLNPQFIGQTLVMGTNTMIVNKIGWQKSLKPEEKFLRVPVSYNSELQLEFMGEILPYYASMMIGCARNGYWPPNYMNCDTKYGKCAFYEICKTTPDTRNELLQSQFMVGEPWNPTNEGETE